MFKCCATTPLPHQVQKLLAPYFPGLDLSSITIHNHLPLYVEAFARIHPAAYTSGADIYFARGCYDPNSIRGIALIAHEIAHTEQYENYGSLNFRWKYLSYYFQNKRRGLSDAEAYNEIPFEKEACEVESKVYFDLMRGHTDEA